MANQKAHAARVESGSRSIKAATGVKRLPLWANAVLATSGARKLGAVDWQKLIDLITSIIKLLMGLVV